jgi:aminoglycoside 3-N-acetyltransferase
MSALGLLITQDRLASDLAALGLGSGDTGRLVGGPDIVHRAIMEVIGPVGTMLMVVGWAGSLYHIAEWSVAERDVHLAAQPPFDPATARPDPEMGTLAACFASWPGVRRSLSPTGNFAALGRLAEQLLADQTYDHYFGSGSPLDKLCKAGGRVLLLGSNPENVTLLHWAEYKALLLEKRIIRHPEVIVVNGQRQVIEVTALDNSEGIVDWPGDDYFGVITRAYMTARGLTPWPVGAAPSSLLDARDLVDFATAWMERHFADAGAPAKR